MEKLLENKSKARVLAFFLNRPGRSFYFGEIKKKLGGRKLNADLAALVKQEILRTSSKRGSKYYRLNLKHPWHADLADWAKRFKRVADDDLVKMIKKVPGIKFAALSGFLAGQNKLQCDLLLVGRLPQKKLANFIKKAEELVHNEINYAVMGLEEFEYRKNTFDRFMKDIFENDHVVLADKITLKK